MVSQSERREQALFDLRQSRLDAKDEVISALRDRLEQAEAREQATAQKWAAYAIHHHGCPSRIAEAHGNFSSCTCNLAEMRRDLKKQVAAQPATTTGVPDPVVTNPKQEPAFQ